MIDPTSDPYGAQMAVMRSHIGTLYDKLSDQQKRIDTLEEILILISDKL